ncbi:MAG: xanthine dehydrogenase family protein subunit M [Deltaproteobacteria bacterium]|nr:xanthine dehydrogenase family protein subunit M [Deltaproteobacteria bacterium]
MTDIFLPSDLDELWRLLNIKPEAALYAGGTDLLVKRRSGLIDPPSLVCLERIQELKGVKECGDEVFVGALTTHSELLSHRVIRKHFPVLIQAIAVLGSPPVRNMGTIGGNIVTASPAGDTLAPLYVLDAQMEIRSLSSSRRVPISAFILGPGQIDLGQGEILAGVWIKRHQGFRLQHYEKVGRRNALACSVVSMAAIMRVSSDNRIYEIRLAWGSVGPTVMRFPEVERLLEGKPLTVDGLNDVIELVHAGIKPIDDIRATASYRREVAGRLLHRLINYST